MAWRDGPPRCWILIVAVIVVHLGWVSDFTFCGSFLRCSTLRSGRLESASGRVTCKAVVAEMLLDDNSCAPIAVADRRVLRAQAAGAAPGTSGIPVYQKPLQAVELDWVLTKEPAENREETLIEKFQESCRSTSGWLKPGVINIVTHRRALRRLLAFCSVCEVYSGQPWQSKMMQLSDASVLPVLHIRKVDRPHGLGTALIMTGPYDVWQKNKKSVGSSFEMAFTSGGDPASRHYFTHGFSLGDLNLIVQSEADAVDHKGNIVELKARLTSRKKPFDKNRFFRESGFDTYFQMLFGGASLLVLGLHRTVARDTSEVDPSQIEEFSIDDVKTNLPQPSVADELLGRAAEILRAVSEACTLSSQCNRFDLALDRDSKSLALSTTE